MTTLVKGLFDAVETANNYMYNTFAGDGDNDLADLDINLSKSDGGSTYTSQGSERDRIPDPLPRRQVKQHTNYDESTISSYSFQSPSLSYDDNEPDPTIEAEVNPVFTKPQHNKPRQARLRAFSQSLGLEPSAFSRKKVVRKEVGGGGGGRGGGGLIDRPMTPRNPQSYHESDDHRSESSSRNRESPFEKYTNHQHPVYHRGLSPKRTSRSDSSPFETRAPYPDARTELSLESRETEEEEVTQESSKHLDRVISDLFDEPTATSHSDIKFLEEKIISEEWGIPKKSGGPVVRSETINSLGSFLKFKRNSSNKDERQGKQERKDDDSSTRPKSRLSFLWSTKKNVERNGQVIENDDVCSESLSEVNVDDIQLQVDQINIEQELSPKNCWSMDDVSKDDITYMSKSIDDYGPNKADEGEQHEEKETKRKSPFSWTMKRNSHNDQNKEEKDDDRKGLNEKVAEESGEGTLDKKLDESQRKPTERFSWSSRRGKKDDGSSDEENQSKEIPETDSGEKSQSIHEEAQNNDDNETSEQRKKRDDSQSKSFSKKSKSESFSRNDFHEDQSHKERQAREVRNASLDREENPVSLLSWVSKVPQTKGGHKNHSQNKDRIHRKKSGKTRDAKQHNEKKSRMRFDKDKYHETERRNPHERHTKSVKEGKQELLELNEKERRILFTGGDKKLMSTTLFGKYSDVEDEALKRKLKEIRKIKAEEVRRIKATRGKQATTLFGRRKSFKRDSKLKKIRKFKSRKANVKDGTYK